MTETIFSWPGLGRLVVSAISNRDYALVQGCLLSIDLTYVLVNLFTDVVYQWINLRMRGDVLLPSWGQSSRNQQI